MRIKNFAYRLMGAVCAFVTVACVDNNFDVTQASTEITVGGEKTTLPLGYLEEMTIASMLGDKAMESITNDEDGNLLLRYAGEGDPIDIAGINTEFEIPQTMNTFKVDYPEFRLDMKPIVIKASDDVKMNMSVLDNFKIVDDYILPEDVALPTLKGEYSTTFSGDEMHILLGVPDQVDSVTSILLQDMEDNHKGAPMRINVDFNDFADIIAGGALNFVITIAGGEFEILNSANEPIYTGGRYEESIDIANGESVDFVIYVDKIINNRGLNDAHQLDIPLELTFDMNFEIDTKPGQFRLEHLPHVELNADFEYGDAEVEVNTNVNLMEYHADEGKTIDINGLPAEVESVHRVDLEEGAELRLFAHGLEWLDEYADAVDVHIELPGFLSLHSLEGVDYEYDVDTHIIRATVEELDEGINIGLDAFDFGKEGVTPDDNGNIALVFAPGITAHFLDGTTMPISALAHDEDLTISTGIERAELSIASVSGEVNYSYDVSERLNVPSVGNSKLEIVGAGIKPIIEVNISNPLTMPAELNGAITPIAGGECVTNNRIEIEDVMIASAKVRNGVIEPAETTIIIADESLSANYDEEKYTFVECDVAQLLKGTFPEALDIALNLGVDAEKVQTIYMSETMSVKYDYKIEVPFALDEDFKIRYNDEIKDLNSMFESLADYDIQVGDLALIAKVTNTTPLQFEADVALVDVDGELTDAQVVVADDAMILGSEDGETPAESALRLELKLGKDGRVANIADVDGVRVTLTATSAAKDDAVAINKEQYVGVMLQMELAGGITVDLGSFITEE